MVKELSAYNESLLERGVRAFERIADALERIAVNFEPSPDLELADKKRSHPSPQCIVQFAEGNKSVPGEWIRHDDKIIVSPLPVEGYSLARDARTGKWFAELPVDD